MRSRFLLPIILLLFSVPVFSQDAQEEELKRPADIKVSDYDEFKNTSFDTYDESIKLKKNVTVLDTDIKNYAGVMKSVLTPKLLQDFKALVAIKNSTETLRAKIASLDEKGKDLAANSKKAGLKAPAAGKNTNSSVSALNKSKGHLDNVTDLLNADMKLLKDELKARGEPIE
jgi:hypothetical protein